MRKTSARYFSLLEIVVGLSLILIAGGAVGWKMHSFVETRRFKTDLQQLKSRILTTQMLAVNMQADWEGTLKQEGKNWIFTASCLDAPKSKTYRPIKLHLSEIFLDGKRRNLFSFIFFSSGESWPAGVLTFQNFKDGAVETWDFPAIFGKSEGSGSGKLGPVHPDEA